MLEDRFLKRLRKKARKGLRGWPIATIAFYGPNLSQATKVAVGILPSENAEVEELRDWKVDHGDIRADPGVARERKRRRLAGADDRRAAPGNERQHAPAPGRCGKRHVTCRPRRDQVHRLDQRERA